jgi:hypothetical protein
MSLSDRAKLRDWFVPPIVVPAMLGLLLAFASILQQWSIP